MFFLPWWTYVLIGTIAFACSFVAVWLAGIAFDREAPSEGPFPCLTHIGHDPELGTLWCWLVHGHDGDHQSQFGLEETAFSREWPEDRCGSPGRTMADESTCFCGADHESPDFSHDQMRQTNAAGDVVIDENPGYLPGSAPRSSLPQRLSKVPVQLERNDPWPQCRQQSSDGRCVRVSGHMMEHDFE